MKNETYDVPGYKFGILKINDHDYYSQKMRENNSELNDIIDKAIDYRHAEVIPFDYVDGLKLKEVQAIIGGELPIIACCYVEYISSGFTVNISLLQRYIFSEEYIREQQEEPIDKAIEKLCVSNYNFSDDFKRMANCFFERYQDKSYLATKERINKINGRK